MHIHSTDNSAKVKRIGSLPDNDFFLSLSVPGENAFHDLLFCVSFPETDAIERCLFEDRVVIILVRMP